ncbi:Cutinase transcription factor 1 beta [Fusarium oxysporum f. sp. cubense]|uniref:Cutinase transcription factor 1 beta n=1 Tax=Fusarium oxysporum f. sp. cubense TaxID=61366 RepID=A0A559KYD9_FUSOC|nr:Cutinase transcription factor 1 beta [Fusarium oxysporum f. sp. cubense]
MLFPNKQLDNVESINKMDLELMAWAESLPTCCQNHTLTSLDVKDGRTTIAVQRALLHMVYYTTISALYRPQFLPSTPFQAPTISSQVQDIAQLRVRDATMHIARIASELHQCCLEPFLPPTGITVIMPAMIIHLLEMKNPAPQACHRATEGFRRCMQASSTLPCARQRSTLAMIKPVPVEFSAQTPPLKNTPDMTASESLFNEKPKEPQPQPTLANAAALQHPTNSQPQPELYSSAAGLTPTASVGSEEIQFDVGNTDLDSMQGYGEFSWNAVAGTNSDAYQWVQPPLDVTNQVDILIDGVLGRGVDEPTMSGEQALSGAKRMVRTL